MQKRHNQTFCQAVRFGVAFLLLSCLMIGNALPSSATSYQTYSYNEWGEPVETPEAYTYERTVNAVDLGIARLGGPSDCHVTDAGEIYILDSPTNRIVILNRDFSLNRELTSFTKEGKPSPLKDASGLFVKPDGNLLIADKGNHRVICCTPTGEIVKEYGRPDSALYPADIDFLPSKVLSDSQGNVYALIEGLYYGAVIYDKVGEFQGFYGSNQVKVTVQILMDYFWKQIMTDDQKGQMARYVPVSYTNMTIDDENFIYTCTGEDIRKLNPGGKNVLRTTPRSFFGDKSIVYEKGKPIKTIISDIFVEPSGIITILDSERGRLFQYDMDSNLLFAFGGIGTQAGTLQMPVAVAAVDDRLIVLDGKKGNLTVFTPTPFGETVRRAVLLNSDGKYDQALEPWNEVLRADSNFDMAYIGIGKAMYNLGEFEEAMECFRMGGDRYNYSIAKKEYRQLALGQNFGLIITCVLILCVGVVFLIKRKEWTALFRRLFKKR